MKSELAATNSSLEKQEILRRYFDADPENFRRIMSYLYDYDKMFYVTSQTVSECADAAQPALDFGKMETVFDMLDALHGRVYTGNAARSLVAGYIGAVGAGYADAVKCFLDKDLHVRVSIATINKVAPGTVKEFSCALANKFHDRADKIDVADYYISRKIDGCRCLTFTSTGESYSREGHEFETLGLVRDAVRALNRPGFVIDGEVCIVDENDHEDFQAIMKLIKRKDFTIPNPKYKIFDILTEKEFYDKYADIPYGERMSRIDFGTSPIFDPLPFFPSDCFDEMMKHVASGLFEGIMYRHKSLYEGKRSDALLKYKEFEDEEFKVVDMTKGVMPVLTDGIMVDTPVMANVIIDLDGKNTCEVGSGFSIEERLEFLARPELIIGHMVTVKYFERTTDQFGKPSLRFPIFKGLRDEMI
jgi:DNA ligase-1